MVAVITHIALPVPPAAIRLYSNTDGYVHSFGANNNNDRQDNMDGNVRSFGANNNNDRQESR